MIRVDLNVNKVCESCFKFDPEMNVYTSRGRCTVIDITCEHKDLCDYLQRHLKEKEMNKDGN